MLVSSYRLRIGAALVLVCLALMAAGQHTLSAVSGDATIAARLYPVIAPIDGEIRGGATAGERVSAGQVLGVLTNPRAGAGAVLQIEAEATRLDAMLLALDTERVMLEAMLSRLDEDAGRAKTAVIEQAEAGHAAALAMVEAAAAAEKVAAAKAERLRRLGQTASAAAREDARLERNRASATLDAERARAREALVRLETARQGTWTDQGGADRPYSAQRADEVRLRLAAIAREAQAALGASTALKTQGTAERAALETRSHAELRAPRTGVVWRSASGTIVEVGVGTEVFAVASCEDRWIEAFFNERATAGLEAGTMAHVRLLDDSTSFLAPVMDIIGPGARVDRPTTALEAPGRGQARVIVAIEPGRANQGGLCGIGRGAEVSFTRPGLARSVAAARDNLQGAVSAFMALIRVPGSVHAQGATLADQN